MKLILFGTVFRTRKSVEKIIIQAIKEGRTDHHLFDWLVHIYNTGILGICIYRTSKRHVDKSYFMQKAGVYPSVKYTGIETTVNGKALPGGVTEYTVTHVGNFEVTGKAPQ